MPIRMEKDDPQEQPKRPSGPNQGNSGGGGGLGGIMKFLPYILMFLLKKPKILIPVLAIGAVWYFFLGGSSMLNGGGDMTTGPAGYEEGFSFGAALSEEEYDKAMVFEPLTSYGNSAQLPRSASLAKYAPQRMHQGSQGSCVGWAAAYSARTIMESRATNQNPNNIAFSPAFLYNQIALQGCQGAYMNEAMESMKGVGSLPFREFGYTESSCSKKPQRADAVAAQQFKVKGYTRLTKGTRNYTADIPAMKQHIAQGSPVVIGMMVGGSFMHQMMGKDVWRPTQRDYTQAGFSGHAMNVIGYDDDKYGGAFHIMNSWGPEWGNSGNAWVTYDDFNRFTKEAYSMFPQASADDKVKFDPNKLVVRFGLVNNATQQLIPIVDKGNRMFQTVQPIAKGDKFKAAITNSTECYTYVFGQETDGSSYVLFPYTDKHSAYCGITGTRLFPRDYSMVADDLGNSDQIAIVISKTELDYEALNQRMNSSNQGSYLAKVRSAIAVSEVKDVKFDAGASVAFDATLDGNNIVGVVLAIDKR